MKQYRKLFIVVLMLLVTTTTLASPKGGNKIFFSYNEAKSELTMWTSDLSGNYVFFMPNQSEFCTWLFNEGKKEGFLTGDYSSGAFIPKSSPQTFKNVTKFDTIECLKMRANLYGEEVIESELFTCVIAEYISKTDVADTANAETIVVSQNDKDSNVMLISLVVVVAVLIIVVVAAIMIRYRKKKQQEESKKPHTKTNSLEVVEVVKNEQLKGLDFIKKSPDEYYRFNLNEDYTDSAVHYVYIHHTVVKKMYDFFKRSLESGEVTNETGCYFVGCWEYDSPEHKTYNISMEDIVEPGDDLEPGEFSFNFGLKIGVKLNAAIEKLSHDTGRDYVHTVWMHSHPGLGLFLSSHDLLVQRQLAYSDAKSRLVAFVVDTNTPNLDLAVFSAKSDGSMNNKEELTRLYSLEELYLWSRKAHAASAGSHDAVEETVAPPPVDLEKYHALQVNHQGNSRILNVYLGSSVINAIDDLLYENEGKHTLVGYLFGTQDSRGNVVVNECQPCKDNEQLPEDTLGLFVVDDDKNFDNLKKKYLSQTKVACVFIGRGEDELAIFTRTDANQPFPSLSDAATCSMKPMKEWLRRRRVYK